MAAAKYSSQYISDRFLPDKAIDLIDEAGSRVRLRHIQLPEEARDLDKELKQVCGAFTSSTIALVVSMHGALVVDMRIR
jgi:ATP-dependent Clp protease ATP-binding subunit ClpA